MVIIWQVLLKSVMAQLLLCFKTEFYKGDAYYLRIMLQAV